MRRLLAVIVVALALPTLAGAGSSPIVSAIQRTADAKSSTMQLSISASIPGQGAFTLAGTAAQRGTSVKMSMRTRVQGTAFTLDAVLLREGSSYVMYMRSPLFQAQLPRGKSWIRIDLSAQGAKAGVDFSSLLNASQSLAPLEAGLVSTTRLGRETVAGRSTTHYRAVIDVQRAARALPSYGEQVAALERTTGVHLGRTPYDVWVGGDQRVRRMRFSTPTAANGVRGKTSTTITFLAFDTPVKISAPPRSQVVSP